MNSTEQYMFKCLIQCRKDKDSRINVFISQSYYYSSRPTQRTPLSYSHTLTLIFDLCSKTDFINYAFRPFVTQYLIDTQACLFPGFQSQDVLLFECLETSKFPSVPRIFPKMRPGLHFSLLVDFFYLIPSCQVY